jgi:hypothetical protein
MQGVDRVNAGPHRRMVHLKPAQAWPMPCIFRL